ncbi:MAG TPA: MIP/aquaporin family protein [Acidimicrobiales bacterium]|nr:MIP/aquaporin family protein [Acidimicrobiales bacterium]
MRRRCLAEFCGTALLVAVVVGSGIAAAELSPRDTGLQLLENAAATAGGLAALILAFGTVSGAHFNPVVSLADAVLGGLPRRYLPAYAASQVAGAITGAIVANLMFELDAVSWSRHTRSGQGLWLGEVVATVGLLVVIFGVVRSGRGSAAPLAVGGYIGAAYFFTSSTSFANPAVTVGRMFSDTFAGIAPASAPAFVLSQLVGGALAVVLIRSLYPEHENVD